MLLLPLLFVLALTQGAPLLGSDYNGRIPDEYIVLYKPEASVESVLAHQDAHSLNAIHVYNISNDYRGFSAHFTEDELAKVLSDPIVKEVHCNGHVHLFCNQVQSPSTSWGLSRISHGVLEGNLPYVYNYNNNAGQGAAVFILDTGVNEIHEQFNGRVAPGQNFVTGEPPATVDQNGHGTHCAGTAAGNTYGIARSARIIPVKVLGRTGGGSFAGVIAGINWAFNEWNNPGTKIPSVASMSLGATADGGMNGAVEAAIRGGLAFAIAAGNSNANACNFYPASAEGAIGVGSTDMIDNGNGYEEDHRSSFSNWGECVSIFAPGSEIPSSYIPNSNSYAVLSGTSMACPHVAGVAAAVLATRPSFSPAQLTQHLQAMSTKNTINNPGNGSPQFLLNGCTNV